MTEKVRELQTIKALTFFSFLFFFFRGAPAEPQGTFGRIDSSTRPDQSISIDTQQ